MANILPIEMANACIAQRFSPLQEQKLKIPVEDNRLKIRSIESRLREKPTAAHIQMLQPRRRRLNAGQMRTRINGEGLNQRALRQQGPQKAIAEVAEAEHESSEEAESIEIGRDFGEDARIDPEPG